MKRLQPIFFAILFNLVGTLSYGQSSSSTTVSTFTPAPIAHYQHLWLHSITDLSGSCNPGTIFFSTTQNDLIYCQDNGVGTGIGTYYPLGGGIWKKSGNNIFPAATATNSNLRIGIGTSTPTTTLDVNGKIKTFYDLTVSGNATINTYNSSGSSISASDSGNISSVTSTNAVWINNTIGLGNPPVYFDALDFYNCISSASDQRFKTNVQPITSALTTIAQLNPVTFHWLDTHKNDSGKIVTTNKIQPERNIGLLAQDLYRIIPEVVTKPADESENLWQISYSELVPLLIQSIKEHKAKTDVLKTQINSIEKRIKILESKK